MNLISRFNQKLKMPSACFQAYDVIHTTAMPQLSRERRSNLFARYGCVDLVLPKTQTTKSSATS